MGSALSSTDEVSESAPFVIHDTNYVFDKKLKIIPSGWNSPGDLNELSHGPPAAFPSLKTFANLANVAYFKHDDGGKIICTPKYEVQLEGFTFLAAANNSATRNGYNAVAYFNRERKQVILSHRGTRKSKFGPLYTDLNGIVLRNFVPQVSSAITFAHKVVHYAAKQGFDVFFTGHSLGGWLAQITTFSTMYLTLDEVTGHFVGKQSPHADVQMSYTVVFDSPGAFEFLFSLKKALFPRHVESTQEISVEALPIEVFLFHPNPVNWINHQIGRVFILDVEKAGVDTGKYFGRGTHGIGPVVKLLREVGEDDAVKWRVTDFRKGKRDFTLNSRDVRERTVPWDKTSVPLYFFSREERKFLEGAKRDFPPEGQFEGVNLSDEETANSLLKATSKNSLWKLTGGKESVVTADGWNRREFIPRVRHTVRCLRQRGTLWWNPRKPELPPNYIDRRKCPTAKLREFTALSDFKQNEKHDIRPFSASEILEESKWLVLFVDPPGMGKSSAMTKLETQLRSEISSSPRVIVRLNLNRVQDILKSQGSDTETPGKPYHSMCFIEQFVENIPVSLLQQTFPVSCLPLYVLLDGLDEVVPEYEQIMTRILNSLISDIPLRLFSVQKVILTTRPHLQTLIEDQFDVETSSLLPLLPKEQVEFLKRQVGLSFEAEKSLGSLPHTAQSLMENPLMLSLYAQILKSPGTKAVVNLFDLYSQFVAAKHELHVVEKEEAEPAKMMTQWRVRSMLDDNLKFYFACAVEELIAMSASELGKASLEQPTGRKLEELISYGLLVSGGGGGCRFKHRSFAEFFYAQLVTHETKEYKKLRAVLFGRMYEHNVAQNVERFVQEILLKRQAGLSQSPESFPRLYLRVEEAALYLGKERLRRLVNGWINSLKDMGQGVEHLLVKMKSRNDVTSSDSFLWSPLKEVRGELAGARDKESALTNFYNANMFPFLCGSSVLLSLDYSDPDIFHSMKYDTVAIGVFLEWLCGLGDRSWVREKVFGMEEDRVEQVWKCHAESAELILMFAVRSDDICEFLSNAEISAALDSLDCVVKDGWRVEDVEVGRVRRTLEKYVDPQGLKDSLLIHLRTFDDFQLRFFPNQSGRRERQKSCFEWSWWYAEVFSRKEVSSFVSDEASRVPNIHSIGWRAVRDAWGEEFELLREQRQDLTWPPHKGKTLLDIKEGDLEFVTFLWEEVERWGLKLEGDLMEVLKEMIFGDISGWKVLEMLERRLVRQRHGGTNANYSQETNILEQLFKSVQVWTTLLDTLQAKQNSSKALEDIFSQRMQELKTLWSWLPFVVRYSGETEPIEMIIERFASITKYLREQNLVSFVFSTEEEYFGSAARSLLLAHSSEPTGSSFRAQLIRSLLQIIPRAPDSLLKVLLEGDEGALGTLITDNSPGTPHTVTHTPVGPVLNSLLKRNISTSDGSVCTLPQLIMESPWNAESVAFILTELIETSPCYELPRALEQFHSSFPPDLIKQALLSKQVNECFKWKREVHFRKYVFVNTERLCSLRAAIRFYFVVFGEDLRWIKSKKSNVSLLIILPVEILSVLEDEEETVVEGFPPLPIEVRVSLVSQIEEKLRKETKESMLDCLDFLAQLFSYNTETDWVRLLQALHLIPYENCRPIGCNRASLDHNHHYQNIVESRLLLIRVFLKYLGAEKTRRSADKNSLWDWIRYQERVPRGECLHLAVEVGSLKGVKTFAWPGLFKWKNPSGKTAGEVAVELWGVQHEISRFLRERFQTVRIFHDEE